MDLSVLVDRLGAVDPGERSGAADALVAAGAPAVAPLLAALFRQGVPASDSPYLETLRRLGDEALAPLVQAIADADDRRQVVDAGEALVGLQVSDRSMFVKPLRHPSAAVREQTLLAFQELGPDGVAYATAVVPLVADPDERVRGRAVHALKAMRPDVLAVLRELRRTAHPARRQALTALAELGGWAALEPADQALIRRFIAVKRRIEVPEPMHLCGGWYALPTDDQDAVLAEFGLSDPFPVTMRLGGAAWHSDSHWCEGPEGARVYVSPVLDGWTLVFGEPSADSPLAACEPWTGAVEALSKRFGEAQHYYVFEGCTGWILGEHGRVVRAYTNEQPDEQLGPPHPAERGYLLPHERLNRNEAVDTADRLCRIGDALRRALFVEPERQDEAILEALPAATKNWFARLQQVAGIPERALPDEALTDVRVFDQMVGDACAVLFAGLSRESSHELSTLEHCYASDIAARASVNPAGLGATTVVRGHGVLALTAIGRQHGTPPGALPI
jgi:hypothetical protein